VCLVRGTLPMSREEVEKYFREVQGWNLIDDKIGKNSNSLLI
jgi:hypothetical protein